jgi:RNA polymerase sigma factor (sigma-70 family)
MTDADFLAARFEENRSHLRAVAYRMLGSLAEADDAVQESWLRLSRSDASAIDNLSGWLTTVVARVSLDMLRSRASRREDPIDAEPTPANIAHSSAPDPEQEALMADSVGLALLVVLDRLEPAERLAFVLHDVFAMPFDEIASIVDRTPAAARQLASRARRRVQGTSDSDVPSAAHTLSQQRETVQAFLAALRAGDFQGLMAVLAPDVIVTVDPRAARPGAPSAITGAENWARGAIAYSQLARNPALHLALINGAPGLIFAPRGQLNRVLTFTFTESDSVTRIATAEVIADPGRLSTLSLAVLN